LGAFIFKNSDETIAFVEQLNKQFKIAGTSQQGMTSATSKLEEVFGSSTMSSSQFDALNSAVPSVMQTVVDYTDLPIDKLKEMASEGQLTSDIVKNSMFAMTEETNAKFNETPTTWAEVWTRAVSKVVKVAQALLGLEGTGKIRLKILVS